MIELLAPALAACLLLACILSYFGLHVLLREVIFVDLALAQLAALGAAVGHLLSGHTDSSSTYLASFGFTLAGAAIFAMARPARTRLPQEALIGIVYGVSAALVILVVSKSALDRDDVESMLTGRLLFANWSEIGVMVLVFAAVALLHCMMWRQFLEISQKARSAAPASRRRMLLDFVFYASFGVAVTSAVQLAGVLVVFGLLIVPASCAAIFFATISRRLLAGWLIGTIACSAGVAASAFWDLPTGAAVVTALGFAFALAVLGSIFSHAPD
ncbi:MAG: metal ABC transporter permease [Thermoleophilia bacterium]|nr:metal ABC transporter permease [Thermoleophilia bacterium]